METFRGDLICGEDFVPPPAVDRTPRFAYFMAKGGPIRPTRHGSGNSGKAAAPKKIQGFLNVGRVSSTCKACGMTYGHHAEDRTAHAKYHTTFINGPGWNFPGQPVLTATITKPEKPSALRKSSTSKSSSSSLFQLHIYAPTSSAPQVARVEALLHMVNQELNAPPANGSWKSLQTNGIPGKAFVAVVNKKAVGLCVTEPIQSAFWVVSKTQQVVPNQEVKQARVGISRIWVAPSWRRCGVAMQLLQAVVHHSVYGMMLDKLQIAFSQPSFAGGLLATRFNGVEHKSGETLVPVYLEQ